MAICTGITYDAGDDRITVEFVDLDTKGNSFNDPYTWQDIYDTDQDAGWGVFRKYGNVYISDASIYIEGADTYFQDGGFVLLFQGDTNDYRIFYAKPEANVNLGSSSNYSIVRSEMSHKHFAINGYINNLIINGTANNNLTGDVDNISLFNVNEIRVFNYNYTNLAIWGGILIINNTPQKLENVTIYNNWLAIRTYGDEITTRNIKIINCSTHIQIYTSNSGNSSNFIDSEINIDLVGQVNSYDGNHTINLKSTFKVNISGGDTGIATLYDQFDNQVAQQTLSGEWELTDPVLYAQRYVEIDGSQVVENTKTTYEPFKLVVTKTGYQTLTIPNITVTAGEETNVYGEMTANPAPLQFSIKDDLSRIFEYLGENMNISETITRWGKVKDLSFIGTTTDSDSYRISYQPATDDYLIEQYISGAWETVTTIQSGDELVTTSELTAKPKYSDRSIEGVVDTGVELTGDIEVIELEGQI